MIAPTRKIVNCAIYTRKSEVKGLEMEFNSLHAQRETVENYIASQRDKGFVALPFSYDDGGFTGGNTDRPALRRIMRDVKAGKIGAVCVYKVDRFSRSLIDFMKLMEVLEKHNVIFIAVTQNFDTSTPLGRLTLAMILSFAQFERELIADRIRDKVAAAKAKGKIASGVPPLGYDIVDGKLVINPAEAEAVQWIFTRFAEGVLPMQLLAELKAKGINAKVRPVKKGHARPAKAIAGYHLEYMLHNRLYLGVIPHGEKTYPGEHEAIISQELWDKVHAILVSRRPSTRRVAAPEPLEGILHCGHCGKPMARIHYATAKNRKHRYYFCPTAVKHGSAGCPMRSVIADVVEARVFARVRQRLNDPASVASAAGKAGAWEHLRPAERERLARQVAQTVHVHPEGLRIGYREGFNEFVPIRFSRRSGLNITISDDGRVEAGPVVAASRPGRSDTIAVSIARSLQLRQMLDSGEYDSQNALKAKLKMPHSTMNRLLRLAFLAPDIVQAILEGREPSGLSIHALRRAASLHDWRDQRKTLGFPEVRAASIGTV